jgi:hypothetical protein
MAEPHEWAAARQRDGEIRAAPPVARVRDDDIERHEGLNYIAKLFKVLALMLLFMIVAEVVFAVQQQGGDAIGMILFEIMRLIIFAGLLWAAGDLAVLLIESNHDIRASRILLGRLNGRLDRVLAQMEGPEDGGGEGAEISIEHRDGPRGQGALPDRPLPPEQAGPPDREPYRPEDRPGS